MAYKSFSDNTPTVGGNGLKVVSDIRENLMAMRDAVVMGAMPGWDYSRTPGRVDAENADEMFYKKGSNWIRATLTWGYSGGAEGNLVSAVWESSADAGENYETIGTETFTYDVSGDLDTSSWS